MGNYDKTKEKIMRTPTVKDIEPRELQSFLIHYGFKLKRTSGSHFIYEYPNGEDSFPIPMHSPIKPAYIDKIREIISDLEG